MEGQSQTHSTANGVSSQPRGASSFCWTKRKLGMAVCEFSFQYILLFFQGLDAQKAISRGINGEKMLDLKRPVPVSDNLKECRAVQGVQRIINCPC